MKKLIIILIMGLFMSSCMTGGKINLGGGGCGHWVDKEFTGTYKHKSSSYRYRTGVH
jgi:accessory colonization factor AcfC